MLRFVNAFQSPLYGVSYHYRTPSGWATLQASTVHLNVGNRTVTVRGVFLLDSSKRPIARAETGEITYAWAEGSLRLKANLKGVWLDVTRDEQGRWNIERLLPPPPPEERPRIPFTVTVEDAQVRYTDFSATSERHWQLEIPFVEVRHAEGDAFIHASASIPQLGMLKSRALVSRNGEVWGFMEGKGIDLTRALAYFQSTPEWVRTIPLPHLRARNMTFDGWAQCFFAPSTPLKMYGEGSLRAQGLRVGTRLIEFAQFTGTFSHNQAQGNFAFQAKGGKANASGIVTFAPEWQFALTGSLSLQDETVLRNWYEGELVPDLSFEGAKFIGTAFYGRTFGATGKLNLKKGEYKGVRVSALFANTLVNDTGARFRSIQGELEGAPIEGEVFVGLKAPHTIAGEFRASGLSLSRVLDLPKDKVLAANINTQGIISGTLESPKVTLSAQGIADIVLQGEHFSAVERARVTGAFSYQGETFQVKDLHLSAPAGVASAQGDISIQTGESSIQLWLESIAMERVPGVPFAGIGFAELTLQGDWRNPRVDGRAEIYQVRIPDIETTLPFVAGEVSFENHTLLVKDLTVRSGVSLLEGWLDITLSPPYEMRGEGSLVDVNPASFLTPEMRKEEVFQGLLEGQWSLSGTASEPSVSVHLLGKEVGLGRISLDSLETRAWWNKEGIHIDFLQAQREEGSIEVSGDYALQGDSHLRFSIKNFPLSSLDAYSSPDVAFQGWVSGEGSIGFRDGEIKELTSRASLEDVEVNRQLIGSGNADVHFANSLWTLTGGIGTLEGYFTIEDAKYDIREHTLSAQMSVLNLNITSLWSALETNLSAYLPPETLLELREVEGKLSASANLKASFLQEASPRWEGTFLAIADDLTYRKEPMGRFSGEGKREGNKWLLTKMEWTDAPWHLSLSPQRENFIEEGGQIDIDGEISRVDLERISRLFPELEGLQGYLDIPFHITGEAQKPVIVASINGTGVAIEDFYADGLNVGPIEIQDGAIRVLGGELQVRGFVAELVNAVIPFHYPLEFPREEPLEATLIIPSRDIKDLSRFFGGLDVEKTEGTVQHGLLHLTGTLAEPILTGTIEVRADALKFEALENVYREVTLLGELHNDLITFRATAKSERDGSLQGMVTLRWTDGEILQGQLNAQRFLVSYDDETLMRAHSALNADLALSGTWKAPKLAGTLSVAEGSLHLLGEFLGAYPPPALLIDPQWEIQVLLAPSRFRSGLLDAVVTGEGQLNGSLSDPRLSVDFQVGRGKISLPSGDVDLEAGGTARLAYSRSTWTERSSLRVNLPARTFITVATSFSVQRYQINLNISGDVLGDQPLHIDAVSDPPDLTRSEILSLLAQRQFFEEIGGLTGGGLEQKIGHIFSSVLAPYALGPLTRSLEREFGLEYVYLDFSQEGIGMIAVGKTLGAGFSVEYRRALTEEMVARFQSLDQIQFNYRPQTRDPFFSHVRASVAYDRLGIWRITLNYGKRF